MISSTALDLPEHREEVMDACLRQGMFPIMMEHLSAIDADAAEKSLAMVDDASIYLGVLAYRYGYVPDANNPEQISITEMEYNRAVERGIPRLIFFMDKSHPLTAADMDEDTSDPVETARRKVKLAELKKRAGKKRVAASFKSPTDLRAQVIQALVPYRESDLATFHYVSDIPTPPEAFIAHPYTLLQTHRLVGRQPELNLLTDWVARPDSEIYKAHILNIVAIGGLGKSALTWKWFNDIAPQEMKPLAGRMWWSFYESDATFENFVSRALAYVTRWNLDEVQQIPAPEREAQLLAALDREPFLIVLDGLERILIAYARMDAAHLSDDDYDRQTANFVANAIGLPEGATQSFTGEHRLRKSADPRAGGFLRKLANVRASRILVSTRLYPADLQMGTGAPLPGCYAVFLTGLADDDALELWRAFGASGGRDSLLPLFQRADNHPLLIQALASEVARDRRAPGDFDAWRRVHPDFNPFSLPLMQVKSHVLEFALRGLGDKAQRVLRIIAAFRMPARYDTLASLLIGEGKPCADERELDEVLTELEDRGLVGWDKRANRYDLHPLVRGVVWSSLGDDARRGVYTSLHAHFQAVPKIDDYLEVNSLEDLTPAIELYNTLIGLGRYDDAGRLFARYLYKAMLYRLCFSRQCSELLLLLFPDGPDQSARWENLEAQVFIFALAGASFIGGQPREAARLFLCYHQFLQGAKALQKWGAKALKKEAGSVLCGVAISLHHSGALHEAEVAALQSLCIAREQGSRIEEANSLFFLGLLFAARGMVHEAETALCRACRIFVAYGADEYHGVSRAFLAQRELWLGNAATALALADWARELAHVQCSKHDIVRAERLRGTAAINLNDLTGADKRLYSALTQARAVNLVLEELPTLIALAELRRQGDMEAAREFLDDVWDAAERGPYPRFHADACNVLAQIEQDEGNQAKAVEAATKAYRLAWCDGPPFAYHWGLEKARKHLRELGADEPEMPPFDESKFEPMPEVEIDPEDEFHAGKSSDN
jgi:tetratricopeptide (TPR) repeat protein